MTIYFELEENPKGTAQMKGTAYQGGRIHHYEKKEVRQLRELYHHKIFKYFYTTKQNIPHFDGAVRFSAIFNYSIKDKKKWGLPKISRPDADNIVKLLLDVCSDLNMWDDDAQVTCLEVRKFYAEKPSICIEVMPYEVIKTEVKT